MPTKYVVFFFFVSCSLLTGSCTVSNKQLDPQRPVLSWSVLDKSSKSTVKIDSGSRFSLIAGHDYEFTLVAENARGIQYISIEGAGTCACSTKAENTEQQDNAASSLPVEIPLKEEKYKRIGNLQSDPTISLMYSLPFPDEFSCGKHRLSGDTRASEYYVSKGTITLTGTARNFSAISSTSNILLVAQ